MDKKEIISAISNAINANFSISVVSISDCRRKILINDSLRYALGLLEREADDDSGKGDTTDDNGSGRAGQASS